MGYKKEEETEQVQLDESTVSRFRKYLSEIRQTQSLSLVTMPSWWDK